MNNCTFLSVSDMLNWIVTKFYVDFPCSSWSSQLWALGPGGRHVVSKNTLCFRNHSKSAVCILKNIIILHDKQLRFFDVKYIFSPLLHRSVGVITYILWVSEQCPNVFIPKPLLPLASHLSTCLMVTWQMIIETWRVHWPFFDIFLTAAEECVAALQPAASTIEHIERIFYFYFFS